TTLVSINSAGTASGNNVSRPIGISNDGRFVAFFSDASDLVTNDTNGQTDAFVRDLTMGKTTLVSINSVGTASGNGASVPTAITNNGRYVAFYGFANDLVPGDTNNKLDAFVRDLKTGTTTLVSINSDAMTGGNGDSVPWTISPTGRYVAFFSYAS